jgi:hypothetical protein
MTGPAEVELTAAQIVAGFDVTMGRVRDWIAAGLLSPVRREGKGRDGMMYFYRGQVAGLVYGVCPVCGDGFKRTTLKKIHCSRLCRDRERRRREA